MTSSSRPRTLRRAACLTAAVVLGVGLVSGVPAYAQGTETPAEKAAREIGEARDRANAAADAWAQAQSDLDVLHVQMQETEDEVAELEAQIADLQLAVEDVAINRFIAGSDGGIPLLNGLDGPIDQVKADVFSSIATDVSADVFDEYDALADDLDAKKSDLEQQRKDTEDAQEYLDKVQEAAYAEIEKLREIEAQRLKDEAVQKALAAQQAEKQRLAEEAARKELAAQQAAATAPPTTDNVDNDSSAVSNGTTATTTPSTAPPTVGGTTGGSTGATSGGSGYVDAIACPVAGVSAFSDTWGAPRSGGRRHEGVDMLGARGTPLAAVTSGYVEFKQNALGGNAVGLTGSNGNYYYYAHLDRYEGSSRNVTRGEIIGYMGDTGNAIGTPHLHFEIHPGGGAAVNPTPTVRAAC